MKWEDIKDSTELAEAMSILVSFIAAVIALKDAQNNEEDGTSNPTESRVSPEPDRPFIADSQVHGIKPVQLSHDLNVKVKVSGVTLALIIVVAVQMLLILFIAYKVL